MKNSFFFQALKYGIVGVMNTLLTAIVIWLMMQLVFGVENDEKVSSFVISVSNTVGYIVGVINSFLWNRSWTFQSKKNWKIDFLRFLAAFLVCFVLQLALVNILNSVIHVNSIHFCQYTVSFSYICQLIGIVFYTVLNFLGNKFYTFKR
jgi:putative flippase GtrA